MRLWALAVLMSSTVLAVPITYSANGTFAAGTATTAFSAPNQTWSFSFVIDSNPGVSDVSVGNAFDPAFSNFTYTLNGSSVPIVPANLRFFSALQSGMFNICFISTCTGIANPTNGFGFFGPQVYSGSESAPTMLTGDFTSATSGGGLPGFRLWAGGTGVAQPNVTVSGVAAPEPSTMSLGAGLMAIAAARLRRR